MKRHLLPTLALLLLCLLVFAQVGSFDFVQYDDPIYVSENAALAFGFSPAVLRYALTTPEANLWHPLTWISHAVDVSLFGQENAAGHHLVNLALHTANAVFVYLLSFLIASRWRSPQPIAVALMAAALFAVHPLHVESVAWISERKGLLSAFFSLLSLLAYCRNESADRATRLWRATSLICFALALIAKPSAVVVPLLLALLDATVLRRAGFENHSSNLIALVKAQLRDKWFYLLLALGVACLTVSVQSGGSHGYFAVPLGTRLWMLPARFGFYAYRTVWPVDLNFVYPIATGLRFQIFFLAGSILLVGGGILSLARLRKQPWLALAWGWAVICFLPVSGISTVGASFTTDRYSYLLLCGVFLGLAHLASSLMAALAKRGGGSGRALARVVRLACLGCIGLLAGLSFAQTQAWADSETLFRHSINARPAAVAGYLNMGTLMERAGRPEEAIAFYNKALEIKPTDHISRFNLGKLYGDLGKIEKAAAEYRAALEIYPDYPPALLNLAHILRKGHASIERDLAKAEELVERACGPQSRLNRALYLNSLVEIRVERNNLEGALDALREALASPTSNPALAAELQRKKSEFQKAGLWR